MIATLSELLAQQSGTGKPSGPGGSTMLIGLALMIGVFWFVMMRGNRKQQKERQKLIDGLKKNDKVMTIGGIVGTVVSVKDHEVVVKVDESNNTKVTFLKKAIQQVINDTDLATVNKEQR